LLTDEGSNYFTVLVQYLEFLRRQYKESPERLEFSHEDFREALKLSDEQLKRLGEFVQWGHLGYAGNHGGDAWIVRAPDEVEDLPENGSLDQSLEGLLFQWFQASKPVFIDDRRRQVSTTPFLDSFGVDKDTISPETAVGVDVLKRRYQVFVSSTYEDLEVERQHVIQALLETKCIPLGMELFPAASVGQWELIKRVIRECDYYLVIVGGRYGTVSESGVGYTEMEFDYAMSIGKPVIGFYHENPDSLPIARREKTGADRKRLKAFMEKVRKKLCRPWNSAADLGSAVKSAILSELEFNAQPGWIRADAVPSLGAVEKLKQRIADLEEELKRTRDARRSRGKIRD
jgi:uncharacterized small protein (DUF1192 family)